MEKEEHEGGYDYVFASSVPVDLTCVVCHSAMRDPVQIVNCGHRFCKLCYEKIKQHSLTRCVDLCCPLDREVIDPTKVFADKAAQRNIFDLIVKCSNHQQGCTWSDELRNIEAHMRNDCEYQMVECEHGDCKATMERRLLAQHVFVCHDHKDGQNPLALQLLDKKIITIEKNLQESTLQKDRDINNLEKKFFEKIKIIEAQVIQSNQNVQAQLFEIHNLKMTSKFQEERIKHLEMENNKLKALNPKTDYLEWTIHNYSQLRDIFYSPQFCSSHGHCCQLYIAWRGRRNGRIEFGFHICRSDNMPSSIFNRIVHLKCIGDDGDIFETRLEPSMEDADCLTVHYGEDVSDGLWFEDDLSMPELNRYIRCDDSMYVKCFIEPSSS